MIRASILKTKSKAKPAPKPGVKAKKRSVKKARAIPPAQPDVPILPVPVPRVHQQPMVRQLFPETGTHDEMIESIKACFHYHIKYTLSKDHYSATDHDRYYALAMTIRDRLVERWIQTSSIYFRKNVKRVYYLSMEYLMGKALASNVLNLRLDKAVAEAMDSLGLDWKNLSELESDAGLGNGGLGRLAACFLDSMATLELPGYGYGVRYDYGIFRQEIKDGYQVEVPDNWLRNGNPWEIERPEYQFQVQLGGTVTEEHDSTGRLLTRWKHAETVMGVPYDIPIPGYNNNTVNNLRLWTAKASEEFDLQFFNNGDYVRAYEQKMVSENITKVLYPNDHIDKGRELRFKQQYFFVACSLQDIIRRFRTHNNDLRHMPDKVAIQLNDTHPAIAIAEMMRLLVDIERMEWEPAWAIVTGVFGYTNHTLMPEALEKWPVKLFEELLPRHLTIIYEINRRFLREVMSCFPNDEERISRMSLVEEGANRQIRMAYLAVVASHSVNGVAALHSDLLKRNLFRDFHDLWPQKFNNKTNGITQRRWLLQCNTGLARVISSRIGEGWVSNLSELKKLDTMREDHELLASLRRVKRDNKVRLAQYIMNANHVTVDPDSLFDVQIKRLHEYKRQVLNILHIIHRYCVLKDSPGLDVMPRTFIFAAKAAPGYSMAKLIIKLINDVAAVINRDTAVHDRMKIVFLSNYRVSLAEQIIPASDLSEQISTAGTEASGTGNMKFALNGALTIGTLDGANIEIREAVGAENFFLFGKTEEEISALRAANAYNPWDYYHGAPEIKRVMDMLNSSFFNLEQPHLYRPIWDALLTNGDHYFHLADFQSYIACQQEVDAVYRDRERWARMCMLNIANMGRFSSDRAIHEYAHEIWGLKPCHVDLPETMVCVRGIP